MKKTPFISFKSFPIIQKNENKTSSEIKTYLSKSFLLLPNKVLTTHHNRIIRSLHPKKIKRTKIMEILFHGLNLSAKRRKLHRLTYQIDVHKSELFICPQTISSEYKSRIYRRRIVLISNKSNLLDAIGRFIKKFKSPDTYTGKGFFFRTDSYKTKKGKEYKR